MSDYERIDCCIILVDISGFTQLLYQASFNKNTMETVLNAVHDMFTEAVIVDDEDDDIEIINTTGDGFYAIATGNNPCEAALQYSHIVFEIFKEKVCKMTEKLPFRQTLDMRIALHWGEVYKVCVNRQDYGEYPLYFSDDLNFTARIINSKTAKMKNYVMSKQFLMKKTNSKQVPLPEEVIFDKNSYPEKLEIYGLNNI